jgi:cell division protein FtsB
VSEIAALKANLDQLQAEVATLKETVAKVCKELGIN